MGVVVLRLATDGQRFRVLRESSERHVWFRSVELSIDLLPVPQQRLLSDADMGERVEYSEDVAEPPQDADHNNCVQNRFDRICHGDELINQPEHYPDDNQCE